MKVRSWWAVHFVSFLFERSKVSAEVSMKVGNRSIRKRVFLDGFILGQFFSKDFLCVITVVRGREL